MNYYPNSQWQQEKLLKSFPNSRRPRISLAKNSQTISQLSDKIMSLIFFTAGTSENIVRDRNLDEIIESFKDTVRQHLNSVR